MRTIKVQYQYLWISHCTGGTRCVQPLRRWRVATAVAIIIACACRSQPPFTETEPGLPLPGLSPVQLGAFERGRALFNKPFSTEQGLGPLFNQDRCGSCHDLPTSGGHGAEPVVKVSRFDPVEGCSTLPELGGDLLQQVVTERGREAGLTIETIPEAATAIAEIRAPAVFGLGLVARISEDEILRRADPDDVDHDGISGRPNLDPTGRVGRFGRKAQHATLRGFIEEALRLEMGITTPENPVEERRNGTALPAGADIVPDPEGTDEQLRLLVDYIDLLAPPQRLLPEDPEALADVEEGERIFEFMGCDACHTPSFTIRPDESPEFANRRFRLYSDLLLHDMGPELASTCTQGTVPSEWKTARLVGLGHRREFLHDGRARRIQDAIELHGGEAAGSRDIFLRLNQQAKDQVLAFLRSL